MRQIVDAFVGHFFVWMDKANGGKTEPVEYHKGVAT